MLFQPDRLKVDKRGYLYHPSPEARASSRRSRRQASSQMTDSDAVKPNPYGKYSLLRSELVISHFGRSLEMRDDDLGGSYEWLGGRRDIKMLEEGEATLGKGWLD